MAKTLQVFVNGQRAAVLETADGFEHRLRYEASTPPELFVSLSMPVRDEGGAPATWAWPQLHPFFEVSLPEGYLLSVLKEQLGPHLGATPMDLLAVVGHNLIGRVSVSTANDPRPAMQLASVEPLLHGEHSQAVFMELLMQYAASGVSGVVPKFLTPETQALFRKGTVSTERHIIKASSDKQPFVALNEHLCMQAAARTGFDVAQTRVSDDGQILIVERFDIDPRTTQRSGFEDFCSLLGLTPDQKYESTWERAARLVRQHVARDRLMQANEQLAVTLLLTHALGNADCHTKNLAFLYEDLASVRVAPIYDMLTILAYDAYASNPPGMYIDGRKSWTATKALWRFLEKDLGIGPARQRELVDTVCEAVQATHPELIHHIRHTPGFAPVGTRMLWEWNEGMKRLQDRRTFAMPDWVASAEAEGLPKPGPAPRFAAKRMGESPLLAPRGKKRPPAPSP